MAGVHFGHELIGPQQGINERGMWEHRQVLALNERLLAVLGTRWDSLSPLPSGWWEQAALHDLRDECVTLFKVEFGRAPLWGLKDPRFCRLAPFWMSVLDEVGARVHCVILHRHPQEVIASLVARDRTAPAAAELLWLDHSLSAECVSRERARVFVGYEELISDAYRLLASVARRLALSWPMTGQALAARLDGFLSGDLRHQRHEADGAAELALSGWAMRTYRVLSHAKTLNENELRKDFDAIRDEYREVQRLYAPVIDLRERELADCRAGFAEAQQKLETEIPKLGDGITHAVAALAERDSQLAAAERRLAVLAHGTADAWADGQAHSDKIYDGVVDLRVENNAHTKMANYLAQASGGRNLRVLEVGCHTGYFGVVLKEQGHEVWGVEASARAAERARERLDHVFAGGIESFLAMEMLAAIRFDAMVFGDVLEHLVDPWQVLTDCRGRLSDDGVVVASLPNVAHTAVRTMLLEGRWEYAELGILDDGHLRFFTRESVLALFNRAGLSVTSMDAVRLPVERVGIRVSPDLLDSVQALVNDDAGDVFQYVVLAGRDDRVGGAE